MADGFENIGWVLSVKDKATTNVDKITKLVDTKLARAAHSVLDMNDSMSAWGDKNGKIAKGFAFVGKSFVNVFATGALEATEAVTHATAAISKNIIDNVSKPFESVEKGVRKSLDVVKGIPDVIKTPFKKVSDLFTKTKEYIKKEWKGETQQYFFGDLFKAGWDGAKKLGTGVTNLTKSTLTYAKTLGGNTVASGWQKISGGLRGATQNIGSFFQKILSIDKIAEFFKGAGGFVGILLGPFGKLLDLFSPFVDMIVGQITPAMETFSAIIESALGPFAMTMEIIARNLATAIVPLIKPLAAFLELAAVQVGVLIQNLLTGKPDKLMAGMFEIMNKARPVLMKLLTVLIDAGKQIGGTLLDGAMQLLPLIADMGIKLLDAFVPLIPPLTHLAVELLGKVFIPLLLKVAQILDDDIIPFVQEWMPAIGVLIDEVATKVGEFWGNLGKYVKDFQILFVDPITAAFAPIVDMAKSTFSAVGEALQPLFDLISKIAGGIKSLVGAGEETAGAASSEEKGATGGGFESAQTEAADREKALAGLTGSERDAKLRELLAKQRKKMAAGGVALGRTDATIGEAGPEMVLPLEPNTVERVLAPVLPEFKFPALDRIAGIIDTIERHLTQGTVRVMVANQPQEAQEDGRRDLMMAPGMAGGGW